MPETEVHRRAAVLHLVDATGAPLITIGIRQDGDLQTAAARTVDHGRAMRDGCIVGVELRDKAGDLVIRGWCPMRHVVAGERL